MYNVCRKPFLKKNTHSVCPSCVAHPLFSVTDFTPILQDSDRQKTVLNVGGLQVIILGIVKDKNIHIYILKEAVQRVAMR